MSHENERGKLAHLNGRLELCRFVSFRFLSSLNLHTKFARLGSLLTVMVLPSCSAPARLLVCALCTFATIACAAPAGGDGPAIKKVYVLFSNHLDIG